MKILNIILKVIIIMMYALYILQKMELISVYQIGEMNLKKKIYLYVNLIANIVAMIILRKKLHVNAK